MIIIIFAAKNRRYTPQFGDTFIEWIRLELLRGLKTTPVSQWTVGRVMAVDTSRVECRCIHADPNYGRLWFHCKLRPYDTAGRILQCAKSLMAQEFQR